MTCKCMGGCKKGGIMMCTLKGWMDKGIYYDVQIKRWMEKGWMDGLCCLMTPSLNKDIQCHV